MQETPCVICGKLKTAKKQSCSRECDIENRRRLKPIPVTKEWLEFHYSVLGWDCTRIAKEVDRNPKRVWEWLKRFDIETDARGYAHASRVNWRKKGQESVFKGKKHKPETVEFFRKLAKERNWVPFDPAVGSYMTYARGPMVHNWKGGVTPERQAFCQTKESKSAVKSVWRRDNATCQKCGILKNENRDLQFDVHHIVSFAVRELRTELSNLILLCVTCHRWVHSNANAENELIKELSDEK